MNQDWYRGPNWNENEKAAFFNRLNRSRGSYNKAQYARIKALSLSETGKKDFTREAIVLLGMIINQWPEQGQLAMVYLQLAECHKALGEYELAIDNYEKCLKTEESFPNSLTYVNTSYPVFIVENNLIQYYDKALDILELGRDSFRTTLPDERFVYHAVRSIIYKEKGINSKSIDEGNLAYQEMNKDFSGFSRHAGFGLVDKIKREYLIRQIEHIIRG